MRAFVLPLFLGSSLAVVAVPSKTPSYRRVVADEPPSGSFQERETARIRAHFDSVLVELDTRDVRDLTPAQRASRARVITTLRTYRDRGLFPHNYDFPGEAIPYFVDRKTGVLCAVAHLLESTGRRDIVDRVAAANNNVWVAELASDTAVVRWLATQGLTLGEAARIQVPYDAGNQAPYLVAAVGAFGASVTTSVVNLTASEGRSHVVNFVGALAGLGTVALGAAGMAQDSPMPLLAAANIGVGGLAVYTSFKSHSRYVGAAEARREVERQKQAEIARKPDASVTPLFSVAGEKSAGLALQVRF